jgi:hypothetical protein
VSDVPATPPQAPAETPAPAAPAAAPAPVVSKAKGALAAFQAKRSPKADAPKDAKPEAPAIPADIQTAAERWRAHEKAESARIKAAAANLDEADQALIDSEPDIARKAALLARLTPAAAPERTPAKPKPAGGPPPASAVDFGEALKDPKAMADAKARDPEGLAKFISSALRNGAGRKSTLDAAAARPRT